MVKERPQMNKEYKKAQKIDNIITEPAVSHSLL
jgi:hypothetical protein